MPPVEQIATPASHVREAARMITRAAGAAGAAGPSHDELAALAEAAAEVLDALGELASAAARQHLARYPGMDTIAHLDLSQALTQASTEAARIAVRHRVAAGAPA